MKVNTHLRELDLSHNSICEEGGHHIGTALGELPQTQTTIGYNVITSRINLTNYMILPEWGVAERGYYCEKLLTQALSHYCT